MQEVILIKNGEIILKGLNRPAFEDMLVRNIRRRLKNFGTFSITKAQSTMMVTPQDENFDIDDAIKDLQKVFGIVSMSRAYVVEKDMDIIKTATTDYLKGPLSEVKSFKVVAKRSDKKFPLGSPQIASDIGSVLLESFSHLTVDIHNPDIVVYIEIRDYGAYIHAGALHGAGGMPVGSNGRAALLISGGIDSPVAGYMMAKRGMELCAVHFASPPYTSERAKNKVLELLKTVSDYSSRITAFVVPFTKIQEEIRKNCDEEYFTIIMRRLMINIACTDAVSDIPVFRPLIGMDKSEIIEIARKIGTFETSLLPFEDCCTVFTPKHPRTKPKIENVETEEQKFDFTPLLDEAFSQTEKIIIS